MEQRLASSCDILPDGIYNRKKYDMAALLLSRENQTVLFKENVMDYLESKEILLFSYDYCEDAIQQELESLKETALSSAKPNRHHKSTVITHVFVYTHSVQPQTKHSITAFRFSKSFRLYLWGWTEARTVLVDLSTGSVFTNAAARLQKKFFAPSLSGKQN